MKDKESGKANASLVISMLALLMAVTGVATAAKDNVNNALPPNSVGTAQLKPGAVKQSDLGKNSVVSSKIKADAVTTKALAPDSVTASILGPSSVVASSLRPNSVTAPALADQSVGTDALIARAITEQKLALDSVSGDQIKDDTIGGGKIKGNSIGSNELKPGSVGTDQIDDGAVNAAKIGPRAVTLPKLDTTPGAQVTTNGTTGMTISLPPCAAASDVQFGTVERDVAGMFDAGDPVRLRAPADGVYRVNASVTWPIASGTVRGLSVSRTIGSGPNIGQHYTVQTVSSAPTADAETNQSLATDIVLDKDDSVTVGLFTCGATPAANKVTLAMNWTGAS
jgi:hypothetical protein